MLEDMLQMRLPSIRLSKEELSNFEDSIQKEWIVTNGLGGYASSTTLSINTRKYHGLLIAAFHPPGDRHLCLAKLDEEIVIGNSSYSLGANEFQTGVFPMGHTFLTDFSFSVFPEFRYALQNIEVKKKIFMPHERNAVITSYNVVNKNSSSIKIRVFPLVNCRHFHSVTDRWRNAPQFRQKHEDREVEICFSVPKATLTIASSSGHYFGMEKGVEKVHFREEAMRGESHLDDWYQPGCFAVDVKADSSEDFAVVAVADENEESARKLVAEMPDTMYDVDVLYEKEVERRQKLLARFYQEQESLMAIDWLDWLILATDMFVVKGLNNVLRSVIAGYHWFESWGRDTFISLPGLMLVTGRFEDARQVFLTFKNHCKDGLIPNFVPDRAENVAYNSVDATLWYVNAILQYLKYTGDFRFVREQLFETLKDIVESHVKGTLFNIRLDSDGLLSHGSQLTWMDASVDGQPVTPRMGKAVEVQALWYNALKIMEMLADRFKERGEAEKYGKMAEKAKENFALKFWDSEKGCLFDVVSNFGRDDSFRPNQIIAAALDFTMLDEAKNEKVVDLVHRELHTPYGLRTLAKIDPNYMGVYSGDRKSRDKAYHNGTVWPWLLGPFTKAFLKTKGSADFRREYALKNFLLPLFTKHIFEVGLGSVSEVFDGDSPHRAGGCIAQAWSFAEPLRAYVEDVMQVRPRYEKMVLSGL
jgi:predicted glycogen debranching enzyme